MELWMQIKNRLDRSDRQIRILENIDQSMDDLSAVGASPDSVFGTVILNTNGIVVDNWISILGHSSTQHAGVADFSTRMGLDLGAMLVVAVDMVGGLFAINMGKFDEDHGLVWYFAPDTLNWEPLGFRYSEFIARIAQGDINKYYQSFRWKGWEKDVEEIDGFNYGILIYPYLWAKECDIESSSRKAVPLKEIIGNNLDFAVKTKRI